MGGGESGRVFCPGRGECFGAFPGHRGAMPEMDVRGGVETDPRMLVTVVPVHETAHEGPRVPEGGEAFRERGQGLDGRIHRLLQP